jgi:hypothetical protein
MGGVCQVLEARQSATSPYVRRGGCSSVLGLWPCVRPAFRPAGRRDELEPEYVLDCECCVEKVVCDVPAGSWLVAGESRAVHLGFTFSVCLLCGQ